MCMDAGAGCFLLEIVMLLQLGKGWRHMYRMRTIVYLREMDKKVVNKCGNCRYWSIYQKPDLGLCKLKKMAFAYTCEETLHPLTKQFYVCDDHEPKPAPAATSHSAIQVHDARDTEANYYSCQQPRESPFNTERIDSPF